MLISCSIILPQVSSAQHTSVSLQIFYDELSPYGKWVQTPDYGFVWVPDVPEGFEPYSTNGYWAYTDDGWTWVSYYSWGWAPFHYGRWYNDPLYGYVWVPGTEWSPGWVVWRHSDDYYGWAPIEPGISITIAYGSDYYIPYHHWRFVRCRDFGRRNLHRYFIDRSGYTVIIHNTYIINNFRDGKHHVRYNPGPDRNDVEKHSGRRVRTNIIQESNAPVRNERSKEGVLKVYRPDVQSTTSTEPRPTPAKVSTTKDLRTVRPGNVSAGASSDRQSAQPSIFQHSEPRQQNVPSNQQPRQSTQPVAKPTEPSTQPRQQDLKANEPRVIPPGQSQPRVQPGQPAQPQPRVQPGQPAQPQPRVQPSQPAQPQPKVQPSQPAQPQPRVQPSPQPRVQPSPQPRVQPSPQPRVQPSPQPRVQPSPQPRVQPSPQPRAQPSQQPRAQPSPQPKVQPSEKPRSSSQPR